MKSNMILFNQLENEIKKERISSCIVYQEGKIKFQYYKNLKSESKLYKVNSVTKSLLSILIGIAIDNGFIEGIHVPISTYFPKIEPNKKAVTIEHLLTMSAGYEWPEWGEWGGRPFPMINSKDWVKYVLEKKIVTSPGEKSIYDSGASQLLSAILQEAAKCKVAEFAEEYLFKPLGINEYLWHEDSKGITIGGFGLSLKTVDMLKIGQLMLQNGQWQNKQIVSKEWVKLSTQARFQTYDHVGSYAYHWWVLCDEELKCYDPTIYFAMGYGGQFIIVSPKQKMVVVFTCAKYVKTLTPLQVFRKFIIEV